MRNLLLNCLFAVLIIPGLSAQYNTERSGYEGDYFSLEGTLEMFKDSRTIRDFERKLNTRDQWINNLDLNYDGQTDYIRVEHRRQGKLHIIILQALVNQYETQDVAVIEIEQVNRQEAILQIIGDEDLYGEEVIVEPIAGYADSRRGYQSDYGEFVNVYYWRAVQDILRPQYTVYTSPYRWQYYPTWWNSWRPVTWNVFQPRIIVYRRPYRVINRYRIIRARNFYRPYRSYCSVVVTRANQVRVRNGRSPIYRPRQNNRNGFSNRPQEANSQNGVRSRTSDVRQPARSRTSPSSKQGAGRVSDARVSSPSRTSRSSQGTIRSGNSDVRQPAKSRTSSSTRQSPSRNSDTRISSPSRSSRSSQGTVRSGNSDVRQPAKSRTSSSTRQSPSRNSNTRISTPSRSSRPSQSARSTPSRAPAKARTSSSTRQSPSRNSNARISTPSRSSRPSPSARSAPSRTPSKARTAPSSRSTKARTAPSTRQRTSSSSSSRRSSSKRKN